MGDKTISCVGCGRTFIWNYGEQRFYKERGLTAPKRCKACRVRRRREGDSGMRGVAGRPAKTTSARPHHLSWRVNPVYSFGLLTFVVAIVAAAIIWWGLPFDVLQSWLLSVSFVTLLAYGYDKLVSKLNDELNWEWIRVPERVLLALTFAGGTVGAILGRLAFHHKTSKTSFRRKFWLVVALQIMFIVGFYILIKPWFEAAILPRIGW
jgi:uncharacterized membrane protein YsdA (DUF1294 family)